MPIRSICFLMGQLSFIPSYFYTTKVLKNKKAPIIQYIPYIFICPSSAYIYAVIIMGLMHVMIPKDVSDVLVKYSDFYVLAISFLLMHIYGRLMKPVGSAARFLYLSLYLIAMPFNAIYDTLAMTVIIDLIIPIVINFIYLHWICRPVAALGDGCGRISGILLSILIIAEALFLIRIVNFLFINDHAELKKYDNFFSLYNFTYAALVLLFVFMAIVIILKNIETARENEHAAKKMQEQSVETIESLVRAIDAKDSYTNGHSVRVATYARQISGILGYDEEKANNLYYIALLHDVGKIGVDDAILRKPGRLTNEEFDAIKAHTVIGAQILASISSIQGIQNAALYHHERWDGNGYPKKLKGEEIPEEARIIAVADAYDAMSSNRSYRNALPQDKVREEIISGSGKQFWQPAADAMLEMMSKDVNYDMRQKTGV